MPGLGGLATEDSCAALATQAASSAQLALAEAVGILGASGLEGARMRV